MKSIYLISVLLILVSVSGCISPIEAKPYTYTFSAINASDPDILEFKHDGSFQATEYSRFSRKNITFAGSYRLNNHEVVMTYDFMGIVRKFEIINNGRLVEKQTGIRYELVRE